MGNQTVKENVQNNAAILEKAPEWKGIFNDAAKLNKELKAQRDKLSAKREAGSGITGRFLDMAKAHYPNPEDWKAAWTAMRETFGTKDTPQVLSDAYSVIRRAMLSKVCGTVSENGKDVSALSGDITKATSFNKLKVGLRLKDKEAAKVQREAEAEKPINKMVAEIKKTYTNALPVSQSKLEGMIAKLIADMKTESKADYDATTGTVKDKASKDAADKILGTDNEGEAQAAA